ncbi:MAG: gluzincin family metallopeptidase [Anaerolineae bacterium]
MRPRCLLILLLLLLSACGGAKPAGTDAYAQAIRSTEADTRLDLERLPRYQVEVTVDPEAASLAGRATIYYVNAAPAELREVYLRLYPNMTMYGGQMTIVRVGVDGHEVPFVIAGKDVDLKVPLPRTLPPQRAATIEIDFSLRYPAADGEYAFFGAKDGVIVLPDFHPAIASLIDGEWRLDASPGFGDAAFGPLSLHQMDVTVPAGYTAIAAGSITEAKKTEDSVTYHIAAGLSRNTVLVVAQGYERQVLEGGEVSFVAYAPEKDRTAARAALTHAAAAASYFEENLGAYPLNTLTFIAVPLPRPDANANGAVLLGSAFFADQLADLEASVVRGVARQWWGFRLNSDPIRDPWIDESLSLYSASLYLRQTHGAGYEETVEQAWQEQYDAAVSSNLDGPLSQPLAGYGNSGRYELLVGNKGPLFWASLEQLLGTPGLLTVMRQIQDDYFYGVVDTNGLAGTVSRVVGPPGTALLDTWVLGG